MTHIQSTINSIVDEIIDINHFIINQSSSYVGGERYDQSSRDSPKLLEAIMSSTSIDQFIEMPYTRTLLLQRQDDDHKANNNNKVESSDDVLLAAISQHTQLMQQEPYEDVARLHAYQIKTDINKLDMIKKQISSCFKLIDPNIKKQDIERQVVVSIDEDKLYMLEPQSFTWTTIENTFKGNFNTSFNSYVFARGNIYVFGGDGSTSTKFSRYSLADRQCYEGDIVGSGVSGGSNISACYDGEKHIYLVGGCDKDERLLNRVDCFDIDTQQFSTVGSLNHGLSWPTIHFNDNTIYMAGGCKYSDGSSRNNKDIISFNVQTKVQEIVKSCVFATDSSNNCFDSDGNVYILTKESFTRHSLTTKEVTILSTHPNYRRFIHLVHTPPFGIIYLGGNNDNYIYSKEHDTWTLLNDDDPVDKRVLFGACLITK
ncbi:hypothetical protein SAMD00019534_049530, partial [Acytostelium subglobosum LB1]|uniref:hypothetical protein n=1 Tax=Acytostelium subglobosum LB1 TaxID=1410327 RepID=UPI000644D6E1